MNGQEHHPPILKAEDILLHVLETLDESRIACTLLYSYDQLARRPVSDVDCIVEAGVTSKTLAALFSQHRYRMRAAAISGL